jgi:hypothetical protein
VFEETAIRVTACCCLALTAGCAASTPPGAQHRSVGRTAAAGSSTRTVHPPTAASGAAAPAPRCGAQSIRLAPGPPVSPATGEHALLLTLVDVGGRRCSLRGYPRVRLYGPSGGPLPFRYRDGGGPYVTARPPRTVVLAPGDPAYVLVAKYRCDLGIVATAASLHLDFGAPQPGHRLDLRDAFGMTDLSYCAGGRRDPGQRVVISPVEHTVAATAPTQ